MNLLDLFITLEFKDNASAKVEAAESKYTSLASAIGTGLEKAAELGIAALEKVGKAAESAAKFTISVGSEFEATMSSVKAIGGFTAEEMENITEKAKEMGLETKYSATEAGQAMYYMAQAGWDAESILSGIAGVMDLAASSGEDLASVSDIVTDALTAFGYSAEDSGLFADVLAAAAADTNTDIGKLGQTFKYVAPIAGSLGYSVEDVAVAAGLMANAGIKASSAGTALRSVLSRLASPTDQVQGAMDTLGISLTEADGTAKSLNTVVGDLRDAFSGLSEEEKVAYASTIAAKTGMSGLLAIVNASDEDFEALTTSVGNAEGAAKNMADTMQDNLKGKFEIFKSSVEGLGLVLYDYMVDPLKWLAENGTASVDALTKSITEGGLSEAMKTAAEGFGKQVTDATAHAQALFDNMSAALSDETNHAKLQESAEGITESVAAFFGSATDAIADGVIVFFGNLSTALTSAEARERYAADGYTIAKEIVVGMAKLAKFGSELQSSVITPLIDSIVNPGDGKTSWKDVGKSIATGIGDGVLAGAPYILEAVNAALETSRSAVSSFMEGFNELMTIPEERMREIDKQFGLGLFDDDTTGGGGSTNEGAGAGRTTGSSGSGTTTIIDSSKITTATQPSLKDGGSGRNVTVNQTIYSEAKTAADLMEEARYEAEKAVLFDV